MDQLYIEIELRTNINETQVFTNVASFLALYTYRYLNSPVNVKLNFVSTTFPENVGKIQLYTKLLRNELCEPIINEQATKILAIKDLILPIYERDADTYIAGISAVCREIISRQSNQRLRELLGFKESCLLAPTEVSIWTRFCELDCVVVLNDLYRNDDFKVIPKEVVRFELHLKEPVRMHNIYKQAQKEANERYNGRKIDRKQSVTLDCNVPKENLLIEHRFAEGVNFTIADLLLYPMLHLIWRHFDQMDIKFPYTFKWFQEVNFFAPECRPLLYDLIIPLEVKNIENDLSIPKCEATSLYKADPKRYKPRNRIYTNKTEIDAVLKKLEAVDVHFTTDNMQTFGNATTDWHKIEPQHSQSSALPQKRLVRKRQQLENMANAVVTLAKIGDRIIDFCSGTGHLAILLALKLPQCNIIIMENKAYALTCAMQRAKSLKLGNCRFYQCNIDYFKGRFDIGTSLHACGSATDIVLQQCQRVSACFVCCPCCYGSLQPMPHIVYPLSKLLRTVLNEKDYLHIAHTADQAHELGATDCTKEIIQQGQYCMSIVDTDRKLRAKEIGYEVILTRLKPEHCTPKNHLLVGRYIGVTSSW